MSDSEDGARQNRNGFESRCPTSETRRTAMRIIDAQNIKLTSVNRKYMVARGRLILSPEYRNFKRLIGLIARKSRTFDGDIAVTIRHSSRLDVDNICKATLDALQECGVYRNDRQIKRLVAENDFENRGTLTVDIEEVGA